MKRVGPNLELLALTDRHEAEDLAADVSERKAIDQERFGEPTGHYEKGRWRLVPMDDIGLYFRLERND